MNPIYSADRSLKGKLRRRMARLRERRSLVDLPEGPIVSFTFDDAPASSREHGAPILEASGSLGTWYVCAGLYGQDNHMGRFLDHDEIADLAARGHEIACHTYSHLDCGRARRDAIGEDCERNREALARQGLDLRHFAYPYGEVSASAKAILGAHYGSMRALHPGLIRRGSDLNQLPAVGIEGADGLDRARRWIDRAVQERAWLILYSHDVRESPSDFGCTPGTLERLVSHAKASGARIARVGDVI